MLGSARCSFLLVVSMTALCSVSLPQTGCSPRVVNSMTSHEPWLMLLCRHILGISEGDFSGSFLCINRKNAWTSLAELVVVSLAFALVVSAMPTVDFAGGGAPSPPTGNTLR
ncbi:hypothetical protein EDD85DRAFT_142111 [Armillaria nabsnona]|nr:hypothetical protein EDD85DRAFT_142111 [Armillaria nabsnona]